MVNIPQDDLLNNPTKQQAFPMTKDGNKIIKETFNHLWNQINWLPIENIDNFYTWEIEIYDSKEYYILDTKKSVDFFGNDDNEMRSKKTAPTLIRKVIPGEKIITYVKDSKWILNPESETIWKEWQYVFQNIDNPLDTYIPQKENIII